MNKYPEYKQLNLPEIGQEILKYWEENKIFEKSVENRKNANDFVFYEGPPSANGLPGIHHVMARTIKDVFCRYQTLKGFKVERKAGWDTHGLPVELEVEKVLGITKDDIGKKISIEEYNKACRKAVMKYKDIWDDITKKIGFWLNLEDPYITYENKYIESVWYLLRMLYDKGLLYKGYTIQPYSPAAGTGLSTHELNYTGCYKNVKDTSIDAQFKVIRDKKSEKLFNNIDSDLYFLAWTTTPWTLPSNTALAVGKNITYVAVKTYNSYTYLSITVILAKDLMDKYFPEKNKDLQLENYKAGEKNIPYKIVGECKGSDLEGIRYEQLLPYAQPDDGDAFKVVLGDFVSTEDGTGIVHIAPSFGADDFYVARKNGLGSLTLVDMKGRFTQEVTDFAGEYVKEEYVIDKAPDYKSVDVRIAIKLKEENKAFKVEKYEHNYPHCWRTDKPILYYPLDSWFIKTTAAKDKMIALNNTINWKPQSTGTGRFGNWLENLQDWNLSRSRYWGIPLPIWRTKDGKEEMCIDSVKQLKEECEKAIAKGFMQTNLLANFKIDSLTKENYETFDLHRPFVDEIVLVSPSGEKMYRETDLIDVWFDSGAMPYAQFHYPFSTSNQQENKKNPVIPFPADFIAEGVDQTRGWFFTLHAIATMCFDSIAYKNVVSNGLVLDKNGQKMSKRYGNAIDPFKTIEEYGPDATRWYMITNAQPWDNLKFDLEGIAEVQRKYFRALYNSYAFFALYANIDGFTFKEKEIPVSDRPEIDRWIISKLNTLIQEVNTYYSEYEPTKAGRIIQEFVIDHLSNWYVRLSRRRFWKGEYSHDKIAAYQTLYRCLEVIARLSSPIAPFFMDRMFLDLNKVTNQNTFESIHLSEFPISNSDQIDKVLEEKMQLAQDISSMVLSLRKKEQINVRQPLQKILIPVSDIRFQKQIDTVRELILNEVNVKELEYITDSDTFLIKKIKPNFKVLGPRFGKKMKEIAVAIQQFTNQNISILEKSGCYSLVIDNEKIEIELQDVEITSEDIPGWMVATNGNLTVALDITISESLKEEGIAREFINRIQNIRKDSGLEVTDKIILTIQNTEAINSAISNNLTYICTETLAESLQLVNNMKPNEGILVEVDNLTSTWITIAKCN